MSELKKFVHMLDILSKYPAPDITTQLIKDIYLLSIQNRIRIIELEERKKDA